MFQAYGLYTHIRANRLRSGLLLAGFIALLHALMFSFALLYEATGPGTAPQMIERAWRDLWQGWPVAIVAAAVWFAIAFLFHQRMIDLATGASGVTRNAAPKLYQALENLCISRGLPMPALKIIETDALNAYASGLRDGAYVITVTRGLIENLDASEIEAVLGHELTHIRNRDTQLMVIAVIFAGIFAFAADLVFRSWNFPFGFSPRRPGSRDDEDGRSSGGAFIAVVIAVAVIVLSWGMSVLIRFAISRTREYLADAGAVELTKNPDAMISALRKIAGHTTIEDMPSRMGAFFIESPAASPETGWLATHPAIGDRIAALMRFAGGDDSARLAPPTFLPADGRSALGPTVVWQKGPWG